MYQTMNFVFPHFFHEFFKQNSYWSKTFFSVCLLKRNPNKFSLKICCLVVWSHELVPWKNKNINNVQFIPFFHFSFVGQRDKKTKKSAVIFIHLWKFSTLPKRDKANWDFLEQQTNKHDSCLFSFVGHFDQKTKTKNGMNQTLGTYSS